MDFLKRWLKEEFILFLWGWGIVLLIIIFSMIAVSLFPDIAINLIGLFVLFDRTTPLLFRALCEGRTLRSATLKMYRINEAGLEVEYFNIAMVNIKITAITPNLHPAGMTSTHLEDIDFRYETITWIYTEGNIMYRDSWNDRCCAW